MIFYSKSTAGFYDSAIHGDNIPIDAVEVDADQHAALLMAQAMGKTIVADASGHPVAVDPISLMTLSEAQESQIAQLQVAFTMAVTQPVTFTTAGGTTKTFQSDTNSQTKLLQTTQGYSLTGTVPSGFYWVSADNTHVAFTLSDLKGLYSALLTQGWAAFQHLQDKKAAVRAATSVADVLAIEW